MRLFGRSNESRLKERLDAAMATLGQGRLQEARHSLEIIAGEGERTLGRDHRWTLFAREGLALTYADAPQRGLEMFEAMLPDFERVFGRESREVLVIRSHLPGFYGSCGKHREARDLARLLVPELERVFGADAPPTRQVRQNRALAEEQVAQAQLEQLLGLSSDPALRSPPGDWLKRAREAVGRQARVSSYRSRLVVDFPGQGASRIDWRFEYVPPDKLHVRQLAGTDFDEWIVLGRDAYQRAGFWFKPEGDPNARINRLLAADKCIDLQRDSVPVAAGLVSDSVGSNYLVLDFDAVPAAFLELFSSAEGLSGASGQTRILLHDTNDAVARVELSLTAQSATGAFKVVASQAYTDYNSEIEIRAPEVQVASPKAAAFPNRPNVGTDDASASPTDRGTGPLTSD